VTGQCHRLQHSALCCSAGERLRHPEGFRFVLYQKAPEGALANPRGREQVMEKMTRDRGKKGIFPAALLSSVTDRYELCGFNAK